MLSRIAQDGHVYWFDSDVATIFKNKGLPFVDKIGIRRASTFNGFCARHDNELFQPLDDNDFNGSPQQCFLLAYRTLCHELYLKRSQVDVLEFQKELDRGSDVDRQFDIQAKTFLMQMGALLGLQNFQEHKARFDFDLKQNDFSSIRSVIVWLHTVPEFVCSGPVSLAYDFQARPIQADAEIDEPLGFLSLSIIPTGIGGAAVFSWRVDGGDPAERLVRSLLELPGTAIPNAIVRLVFTSMANVYMSIPWWKSLPANVTRRLTERLLQSAHPEFEVTPDVLLNDGLAPVAWRLARIETNFGT